MCAQIKEASNLELLLRYIYQCFLPGDFLDLLISAIVGVQRQRQFLERLTEKTQPKK